MGFNKAVCVSDYVQLKATRELGCEVGLISNLTYAGIIPAGLPYENNDELYYGFCGDAFNESPPNGAAYPPGTAECTTKYLNNTIAITDNFNKICGG